MKSHTPVCCILPPHILVKLSENPAYRDRAMRNLMLTEQLRGRRTVLGVMSALAIAAGQERRTIYDDQHGGSTSLPGQLVRGEGDNPTADDAVNEAYDYSGDTYDFYQQVFGRNSIDNRGMRLDSSVHYETDYDNAFWNGQQMVYGDGDGQFFQRFTICLDVVGHELTHGVTASTAQLEYQGESGALNESFSDVFGSLVKQRKLGQSANEADWLIGAGMFTPNVNGTALRSMAAPGTAYDDPNIGKDPQPADMSGFDPQGDVHTNSGIPNHAFYLAAMKIGGNAWEKPGLIWYRTLTERLQPTSSFQDAADLTVAVAGEQFGAGGLEQKSVQQAWQEVGISPSIATAVRIPVAAAYPQAEQPAA
ncbi:MAG TPA: M4 family metallopeptidase [Terriglobales bacterium]